ncbi:Replication-associated protein G2P [Vibrio crassostreae]|nr:Replication-associated protein G2P [Vibrio crassostreae]CAK2032164.1 Replication-associated protein G2P [Vibrio crassostreae]
MIDFIDFKIPLRKEVVVQMNDCGFVDFKVLAKKTGLKISAGTIEFSVQGGGNSEAHDLYCAWQTIPSSYTDIACKVFDSSFQANIQWPYIEIKASPAKVIQGHNVYGSESLRLGIEYMLDAVRCAQPELFDLLDVGLGEITRIDSTYSIQCSSKDEIRQTLKALGNIANRSIRPARNTDFETSVYFNKASAKSPDAGRTKELLVYSKGDEVLKQLDELKRKARKEKTSRYQHVIDQLNNPELRQFAACRLRFEGRAKKRFIMREVGSCNIWQVLRHAEKFEQTNDYSFCEYLFKALFKDLLDAIEGEELEIYNDQKVKQLLRQLYQKITPKGNTSYAKADRLYGFYTQLCDRGWFEVKGTAHKATFYRNVRDLQAIGFSRADLQNLKEGERMPLSDILQFDFDNQRPADYVEPVSPFASCSDQSYLSVAFGVTDRISREFDCDEPERALRARLGLDDSFDLTPFLNSEDTTVPVCPRESLFLVIWPDGELTLTRGRQRKFKPNLITAQLNPEPERGYTSIMDSIKR